MILNTLIYDGKVERTIVAAADGSEDQTKLYRAVRPLIPPTGLMRMPCGVCPVSIPSVLFCDDGQVRFIPENQKFVRLMSAFLFRAANSLCYKNPRTHHTLAGPASGKRGSK